VSPRAACRLESLGYAQVFDYLGGKRDWTGAGWPIEGRRAGESWIGGLAHRDVPRARLEDEVTDVARRVQETGYDFAVVVTADDVVLGMLEPKALKASGGERVEEVMRPGPSTYRPDVPMKELLEKLQPKGLHRAIVATPEGRLLGVVLV
jgi:predicted transcriptional regulator